MRTGTRIAVGVGFACATMLAVTAAEKGSAGPAAPSVAALKTMMEKIRPLFTPLGKSKPGDWLESHPESGQTFVEYVRSEPTLPTGKRKILYIQPLGEFTEASRKIIALTAEFMGSYFNLPVKVLDDLPLSVVPDKARRTHPSWGMKQVLSTYVLDEVLKPRLPQDAAACIAFTSSDLWPGEGWNFVFGQASLADRVGVWSLFRNGKADGTPAEFRECLLRTLKTATHETGHMFGMTHCTAYDCNMCGSNNREEADRRTVELCPECVAKIWWGLGVDPAARYRKLSAYCGDQGLKPEAELYRKLEGLVPRTLPVPQTPK